jgi:hypothetical protein
MAGTERGEGSEGTEGPAGHEAGSRTDDRSVPLRVFLAVGGFYLLMAVIYAPISDEWAGTTMLFLAATVATWCAIYLWLQQRPRPDQPTAPGRSGAVTAYLPHASVWPFAIGLGAATILNGLVLGIWVLVPGAALMALGIGGFVRQTRRRD